MSNTLAADYSLSPSNLASALEAMTEAGQPTMVWGPPGVGKSDIAKQVAASTGRTYIDIRALLLDPVDLRGIPWRDETTGQTRWAPPDFLPPTDSEGRFLINLEELPSAVPMVQAALYQLVLDRRCGEYTLPAGAALIACGNRESDRGVVHRMPTPLASRFIHLEVGVSHDDWQTWAADNGIAPQVMFFLHYKPSLLHSFNPDSAEKAFPCPRTWEFVSRMVQANRPLNAEAERAIFRGAIGEGAGSEFSAFLRIWRELPHPQTIIDNPETGRVPTNSSALIALCGALYEHADDTNFEQIGIYGARLRPEIGEFLISSCVRKDAELQYTATYTNWQARNLS